MFVIRCKICTGYDDFLVDPQKDHCHLVNIIYFLEMEFVSSINRSQKHTLSKNCES